MKERFWTRGLGKFLSAKSYFEAAVEQQEEKCSTCLLSQDP